MRLFNGGMCKPVSVRIWAACVLGILVCAVLVTGCEKKQEKMADPKGTLERLAEEYWNKRLIARDYKAIYKMELQEGSIPFEDYVQRVQNLGQIPYTLIKTKGVKIDKDKGFVELTVKFMIPAMQKEVGRPLHDTWIVKSNQWKHVLPKK